MTEKNLLCVLACALLLAACSGSGQGYLTGPAGGGSGGTGSGGVGSGGTGTAAQIEMGSTVNGSFQRGSVSSALPSGSQLAAGGSIQLSVSFRLTSNQVPVNDAISVSFESLCPAGTVVITPTPAIAQSGTASVTYTYNGGCPLTQDTVTATATVPPGTATPLANTTASATVLLAPTQVGAIEFVSADPTNIGLRGTGRTENSTVMFLVRDSGGAPRPNADVTFALSTSVGGITLQPPTARTDTKGLVRTVVKAGTVATVVRVTATVQGPSGPVSTQSSQLTITTGIPDQDSMSLSLVPNPEAYDIDGTLLEVRVRLADRFNNPVPDGTAVSFTTEGGKIGGHCTTETKTVNNHTESGSCAVTWVGQNPRPDNGRVTILATAVGEESFKDLNGNGVFDQGDNFADKGEPFRDDNENGVRDPDEPFYDFNNNGAYDGPNGLYDGLLCQHPTLCGPTTTTAIGTAVPLVMSGSMATIEIFNTGTGRFQCLVGVIGGTPCSSLYSQDLKTSTSIRLRISDYRGQVMPWGSFISIDGANGEPLGPTSYVQAESSAPGGTVYEFWLLPDSLPSSGVLMITVTSPFGIDTRVINAVTITD